MDGVGDWIVNTYMDYKLLKFSKNLVIATVKPALIEPAANYSQSTIDMLEFN